MTRLRMALLGLSGVGPALLERLRSDERVELVAVAERDRDLMRGVAGLAGVRFYEDYRSLIVEESHRTLDGLFVALEPFESVEFVELAAERNLTVFHQAPFARTVAEGRRIVSAFSTAPATLVISRPWLFDPVFASFVGGTAPFGRVWVANVLVSTPDTALGWRGDQARAGGGVLLNGAYDAVDLLVGLGGLPELVYAECGRGVSPGAARSYDTEDFVTVTLRFGRDQIGTLTAWRGAAQASFRLSAFGSDGTLSVDEHEVVTSPRSGAPPHRTSRDPVDLIAAGAEQFLAMKRGDVRATFPPAREHLNTLAVIEAAYLSAKTGTAESPRRFLE